MCILSIVKSEDRIVITSNRDEQRTRKNSLSPEIIDLGERKAIMARDAQAQGTWLLSDNLGRTAILLNGAFESHIPNPPYRESRGIILVNLFQEENFKSAFLFYNLENIEPFQVIYLDREQAFQSVWDGKQKHLFAVDLSTPQVFFSPTLYTQEQQEEKRNHFLKTLAEIHSIDSNQLLEIHSNQNIHSLDVNFFMSREHQTTKSISQVELNSTQSKYVHWQSWDNQRHQHILEHVTHA
jgi:uncharacterized protein with NRDE domain